MGTIQDAIRQANLLEHELRKATLQNKPLTIYELFAIPELQAVTTNPQQLRDKLNTLQRKGMVTMTKIRDSESHNQMNAYQWDKDYTGHIEVKRSQLKASEAKPSKPIVTQGAMPAPVAKAKGVELVLGQVSIVILSGAIQLDTNPLTNRSRITIEE